MVADMVAFVASQFTTSTWDVGAQELCSVVLIFVWGVGTSLDLTSSVMPAFVTTLLPGVHPAGCSAEVSRDGPVRCF